MSFRKHDDKDQGEQQQQHQPSSRQDAGVMAKEQQLQQDALHQDPPQNPQTDNAPPSPRVGPQTGSPIAQLFDRVRETKDLHTSAEALVLGIADLLQQGPDGAKFAEAAQHLRQNCKQWGGAILANTPLGQVPNANVHA